MATAKRLDNPTYTLELTADEADGLATLIGWGTSGEVALGLSVRGVREALQEAGARDREYGFSSIAKKKTD